MTDLKDIKNIHFIGIGGIGMSAIADILLEHGYSVSGSDMRESEETERLRKAGAKVFIGHKAENVDGADALVYSAAIHKDNPEIVRAMERNIPIFIRAEFLGLLMDKYPTSIAVSGTHGKTTTTSMVSLILKNAELDPTILVGGNLAELNGNVRAGKSEYFITEACEYVDSFLSLNPKIEIILNIDSDHLDYFKDIDHIARSFAEFASHVPENGTIIAYDANPFVNKIIAGKKNVVTFGLGKDCDYRAENIIFSENGFPEFDVFEKGGFLGKIKLLVPGEHNILNALAAIACSRVLGVSFEIISETLGKFKGTKRRFDILGTTKSGLKIVDDYAHHPSEIKATLSAATMVSHKDIWCIFQPHTYTRTIALFDEFADAFEDTDHLIFAEIYAAREKNIHKISSGDLAENVVKRHPGKDCRFIPTFKEIYEYVEKTAKPGDLVITMGAGDVYKVADLLLDKQE